jgi:hypothetical protein
MNFESRLKKLEAKAGSGKCTCSGPLVVWPDQTDLDATCPKCGRERVVLKVEYSILAGPEGMEATIAQFTPEHRKEVENAILTGTILLPKQEDYPPSPTALKEYHTELRRKAGS